jgi:hypothetical protein
MEPMNTKQRLEELYDLLQAKYITESEFRVARANIFRESGIDLTPHQDGDGLEELYFDDPEPRGKGCGCGCLLAVLLLLAAIVVGTILAVPEWPDALGGQYARVAREEIVRLWNAVFPSDEKSPGPVPAPLTRSDAPAVTVAPGATSKDESPVVTAPDTSLVSESPAPPGSDAVSDDPGSTAALPAIPETPLSVSPEEHGLPPSPEIEPSVLAGAPAGGDEPEVTIIEVPPVFPVDSPQQQPARAAGSGFVSANSARVRSAPDTSDTGNVVGWGRKGDRFAVLEQGADKSGGVWYRVRFEGSDREGWISGTLVRVER